MTDRYRTEIARHNLGRVSDRTLQTDLDGELAKENPTEDDRAWIAAVRREIDRRKTAQTWTLR